MADLTQFLPVFQRTEAQIRADWDALANLGLSTGDPDWVDTREGGFYHIATQPAVVESARLWDAMTETAAAAHFGTAWGEYLDEWAASLLISRDVATKATGQVTFTGTVGTLIPVGIQVGVPQTDPDVTPPTFVTTESGTIPGGGTLTLAVEAQDAGTDGNVGAASITLLMSPLGGIASVSNANATANGTDDETDLHLREKIQLQLTASGSGNIDDYKRWTLAYSSEQSLGIGLVDVVPVWNGAGTVLVTIATATGQPCSTAVVNALQAYLDSVAAQGQGRAGIGATVTVKTVTTVSVTIAATVTYKPGYSLTGTTGTVALQTEILSAISDYFADLRPGDDVIYNAVRASIFEVEGVLDVTALTLNAGTSNVAIAASPNPQIAVINGTPTIS